jgi:hypothetical protein
MHLKKASLSLWQLLSNDCACALQWVILEAILHKLYDTHESWTIPWAEPRLMCRWCTISLIVNHECSRIMARMCSVNTTSFKINHCRNSLTCICINLPQSIPWQKLLLNTKFYISNSLYTGGNLCICGGGLLNAKSSLTYTSLIEVMKIHNDVAEICFDLAWNDRLCGLVVRVSGYRSRGPGFDSWRFHIFWEAVGLEQDPLSFVRTTEVLLGRYSSGSGQENRD